jgi:hypothetical protein
MAKRHLRKIEQMHGDNIQYLEAHGFKRIRRLSDGVFKHEDRGRYIISYRPTEGVGKVYLKLYTDGTVSAEANLGESPTMKNIPLGLNKLVEVKKANDSIDAILEELSGDIKSCFKKHLDGNTKIILCLYPIALENGEGIILENVELGVYDLTSAEEAYNKIIDEVKKLPDKF